MKPFRALAAGAILAAAIGAPASAADDESRVRLLHASPDAPAVDVRLDGQILDALTNVPFATVSDYLAIPSGTHHVQVFATGTDTAPVIDTTLDLAGGTSYTVAATNAVASIEARVLEDAPAPLADEGQIRVVHFSADAPAVDIAPDGGDALVDNLAYPDATDYLGVPAGTYDLEVRPTDSTDVALQLDPIAVEAGVAYSVFAIGSAADPAVGGNALQVVTAVDARAATEPTITMPPTDADGGIDQDTARGGLPLPALLVVAGAIAAMAAGVLRFRRAPIRR